MRPTKNVRRFEHFDGLPFLLAFLWAQLACAVAARKSANRRAAARADKRSLKRREESGWKWHITKNTSRTVDHLLIPSLFRQRPLVISVIPEIWRWWREYAVQGRDLHTAVFGSEIADSEFYCILLTVHLCIGQYAIRTCRSKPNTYRNARIRGQSTAWPIPGWWWTATIPCTLWGENYRCPQLVRTAKIQIELLIRARAKNIAARPAKSQQKSAEFLLAGPILFFFCPSFFP